MTVMPALKSIAVVSWFAAIAIGLLIENRSAQSDETPAPRGEHLPPQFPATTFPLDFIIDRTDLNGDADTEAYFGLLDYARRVDPPALEAAAQAVVDQAWKSSQFAEWPRTDFPFYYELTKHPERFRGKPVTLHGHIQLHHVDHIENPHRLDPIHVAYLYTDDSQHHPARIVFTENPDDVPVGEAIVDGVSVTGYFLKLYRYEDRDGKGRFMPVILARSIHWTPPQGVALSRGEQVGLGAIAVACVAGIVWYLRRSRRLDAIARERERSLLGTDQPPDFSTLPP